MPIGFQTGALALGRYRGAPIRLNAGFFIAALLLTVPFWRQESGGPALVGVMIGVLFFSVLVHELAHAVVGRRFGIDAERIEIDFYGGLVVFPPRYRSLGRDLLITLAGPLSNLALAGCVYGALVAIRSVALLPDAAGRPFVIPDVAARAMWATVWFNLGLAVVNLLPGMPLDGGRVLYLLIERRFTSRVALRVVAACGLVFAVLGVLVFLGTTLSGYPVWAPPHFGTNWRAFQAARSRFAGWDAYTA